MQVTQGSWFIFIPYYFSIKLFLNLRPRNPPTWSYVISTRQGYLTIHVVSTKLVIVITLLSIYCIISSHRVMGYTTVTDFNIKGSFPFLRILYGPIRSTHSLFYCVFSSILAGNLSYFCWPFFMLECVTIIEFLLYNVSNAQEVQMLANNCLSYIQYMMKWIHVVPFHYVFLWLLWNDYLSS